jgi:sRNA-binding carbon storage regulator CsrA
MNAGADKKKRPRDFYRRRHSARGVEVVGAQVKIGIQCPEHVAVMRGELGPRTKRGKWPSLTPDEMAYLLHRFKEVEHYWETAKPSQARREAQDLEGFIEQLQRWAFEQFLERYTDWYHA